VVKGSKIAAGWSKGRKQEGKHDLRKEIRFFRKVMRKAEKANLKKKGLRGGDER